MAANPEFSRFTEKVFRVPTKSDAAASEPELAGGLIFNG
jgi:hypothetical protein